MGDTNNSVDGSMGSLIFTQEEVQLEASTKAQTELEDVPFINLRVPVCRQILYQDIGDSGVSWWDVAILIPNCIFLAFLGFGLRRAIRKLRASSSPIFSAFYGLVIAVCIISVLRCVVSMTINAAVSAGGITDKILWLVLRFALLATELSVVIFGLAFGHLDSRTSIQRVLLVTFSIALLYSAIQGTLELVQKHPDFQGKSSATSENGTDYVNYDLFAHGGMIFLMTTSLFFSLIYAMIVVLPFTSLRERFQFPTKRTFYYYCGFLALLNFCQAVASLLLYANIPKSLCVIDVTTYLYFALYNPLVYIVFLWNFFRVSGASVHFSYKYHLDPDEEDEDASNSGAGLDDDQMSLPVGGKHYVESSASRGGGGSGGDLSPFYSVDSTHFDVTFTSSTNSSQSEIRKDAEFRGSGSGQRRHRGASNASINGDLYSQVVNA